MEVLEFDKVKQRIQAHAACSLGKDTLDSLGPYPAAEAAEAELAAVDECLQLLYRCGDPPFGGVTDVRSPLRRAALGGTLSGQEVASVADFIAGGRRLKRWLETATGLAVPGPDEVGHPDGIRSDTWVEAQATLSARVRVQEAGAVPEAGDEVPAGRLRAAAGRLFDARQTEQEIRRVVDEDGNVMDHASPLLHRLRSERRQQEQQMRQVLERMVRTHQRYLQEPTVVMRGNSLCLPVRVEHKQAIRGVVHDVSSSGATVFIEPQEAVEAGHRVRELLLQEEREVERILAEVSGVIGRVAEPLLENAEVLAELDRWFAKASWAKQEGCERPLLRRDGVWNLVRARHPLLPRETAVPMDISLGESYRMIIITGPNTGGKTVALKTVGLLTLLAMSGCFIPAAPGTAVGWCDEVFVDIGDEQSIEQSLSTFSSHMRNIVAMLREVSGRSLVLLDELGAGTDPTEGAALAVAILDYLRDVGCRVMATTHFAELKEYAFREPEAVNASVEFDVETLRPTYRLRMGIPCRSNALAIAERLGVPAAIVE
ncbi:MAG: endonuclease MutS2, partial [Alicyclobacillus sp.]|nr:endonuclease MutS2 [Alicyclobacillus sp.]